MRDFAAAHPARLRLWLNGLILAVALGLIVFSAARLLLAQHDNSLIRSLGEGHDLATSASDPAPLLYARLHFLLVRDRLDEAQPVLNQILRDSDAGLSSAALYVMANARLRVAFSQLEQGRIDPAIPLVRLAKEGYRRSLSIDPDFWDAKYNLDVAMRLVRDFPQIEQSGEEVPPEVAKKLWTELPGLPKGLP